MKTINLLIAGTVLTATLASLPAQAHKERPAFFPNNRVSQQPVYRPLTGSSVDDPEHPALVVCKRPGDEGIAAGEDSATLIQAIQDETLRTINQRLLAACRYEHIQQAVEAVSARGTNIYILPGIYREQPSVRARLERGGAANPADIAFCTAVLARGSDSDTTNDALTYEEQFRCPFIQNTVAIFGDRNFSDDNCEPHLTASGGEPGICSHPETVACNPALSACPYNDLQIEGTGAKVNDVILSGDFVTAPGTPTDGHFRYINGFRGDRTDGIYFRNLTVQIFEFNGIYTPEVDGYAFDHILARWNDEYGLLSFAADHGLFTEHETYGNSDSGPYPGAAADVYKDSGHAGVNQRVRSSVEMRNGLSHHNALGYSGTAGNSTWVHDNRFYKNQTGFATDSFVAGHPGHPQDHDLIENNWFYNNNKDYTSFIESDGPCIAKKPRDRGLVPADIADFDAEPPEAQEAILDAMALCPTFNGSIGTGVMIAGGNYDTVRNNLFFDNWKNGAMLFHVPASLRNEMDPAKQSDNSHYDRFLDNQLARNPLNGRIQPNGVDFWFDASGVGNCWDGNVSATGAPTADTDEQGTNTTNNYPGLQHAPCPDGLPPDQAAQAAAENPARVGFLADCAAYKRDDPTTKANCDFTTPAPPPPGREDVATVLASRPVHADSKGGETLKSGYFVLDNDTSAQHQVAAITIDASGPVRLVGGLTLSVTVAAADAAKTTGHRDVQTFTANTTSVGDSNVFTFASPVPIEPATKALFVLTATVPSKVALKSGGSVMLASAGGSAAFGLVMLVGAPRRRRTALAVTLVLVAASFLSSCGSSAPAGGGPVGFKVTALDVSDTHGAVSYAGLPLAIGTLELH